MEDFDSEISLDLSESSWIDCLQRKIKFRKKSLPEIMSWCEKRKLEIETTGDNNNPELIIIYLFVQINETVMHGNPNNIGDDFLRHIKKHLMHNDCKEDFLPVIVHSYIKPTMSTPFMLHIMLSMGRFDTELDLIMHPTMQECLRYCKLIGNDNYTDALQEYANNLTKRYVEEQVQYFPNTQRVIDYWIVTAHELFCSIIVRDELPVTEMPPVLLSNLLASNEAKLMNH